MPGAFSEDESSSSQESDNGLAQDEGNDCSDSNSVTERQVQTLAIFHEVERLVEELQILGKVFLFYD